MSRRGGYPGSGERDDNRGDRMLGLVVLLGVAFVAGLVGGLLIGTVAG